VGAGEGAGAPPPGAPPRAAYYARLAAACDANARARGLSDTPGRLQLSWLPAHVAAQAAGFDLHVVDVPAQHAIYVPPGWWHATLNVGPYNTFVSTFTHEAPGWAARPQPAFEEPDGWVGGEDALGAGPPEGAGGAGGAGGEGGAGGADFPPHGGRAAEAGGAA